MGTSVDRSDRVRFQCKCHCFSSAAATAGVTIEFLENLTSAGQITCLNLTAKFQTEVRQFKLRSQFRHRKVRQ